ncbi:MAG: glutathione S-transferase family protein [Alphaproteobacteria bacterium]|nr:glutathione S-transferase family protein [Alphaproteobacteria bacterium]
MTLELFHHPFSRAANVVWMLEEVGLPYTLRFVDLRAGEQKTSLVTHHNPMGKLPVLIDGDAVVTETAAIGVYLADRHAPGRLAPALDDPQRGTFLRWAFYAPSVVEPGCAAKAAGWEGRASSLGWGTYEAMLDTLDVGLGEGPWLLGERFTMADVILGATLRWMLGFKMIEPRDRFVAYAERLAARPALQRADARNAEVRAAHGL